MTDSLSSKHRQFLEVLNPLNIETRYPAYKDGIYATLGDTECKRLIEDTKELLLWIKQQL